MTPSARTNLLFMGFAVAFTGLGFACGAMLTPRPAAGAGAPCGPVGAQVGPAGLPGPVTSCNCQVNLVTPTP